jgi:hypothetical protein
MHGAIIDEEIEGLVIVVLDGDAAADGEIRDRGGVKIDQGDRVAVAVASPREFGGQRINIELGAGDAKIVSHAGSEEQAMLPEGDRAGVAVMRGVLNEQRSHGKWKAQIADSEGGLSKATQIRRSLIYEFTPWEHRLERKQPSDPIAPM